MDFGLLQNMSLAGFLTLAILLLCSLTMVALGLELRKRAISQILEGEWLLGQLRYLLFEEEVDKSVARDYLGQLDRPITRICSELLCLQKPTLEAGDYLLSGLLDRERLRLEQGLSHLGTIAVIAPFVGLFGTVWGIMNSFQSIAVTKQTNLAVVAPGIAEALFATALGLIAAIPAVIAYNKLSNDLGRYAGRMETFAGEFIAILSRQIEETS